MKRNQFLIIILILFLVGICFIISQPKYWSNNIEEYFNNYFEKKNDIGIKLGLLEGNIFSSISGKNTELYVLYVNITPCCPIAISFIESIVFGIDNIEIDILIFFNSSSCSGINRWSLKAASLATLYIVL